MNDIQTLNLLLAGELTAIHQYVVHAEMAENWGYASLHQMVKKRAMMEMRHASSLMSRILALGGLPVVNRLNPINTGREVPMQFQFDRQSEVSAIADYKMALRTVSEAIRPLLEANLKEEEDHLHWLETQLSVIAQLGVEGYLSTQK